MRQNIVVGAMIAILMLMTQLVIAQDATPLATDADIAATEVEDAEGVAEDIVNLTSVTAQSTAATLEDFLNRLVQPPQSDISRVLLIGGGLILLLAGWRIYEVIILIAGFLIGASIATSLVVTDSTIIALIVLLVGGIVGAALSIFLYFIAVFLIGAYVGIALTGGLAAALSLTPVSALVLLVGGLIGGLVLVGLSFEFLVFVSAVVGAQMLTLGLGLDAVWTIILAIIGIVVQLALTRTLDYEVRRRPRRIHVFGRSSS